MSNDESARPGCTVEFYYGAIKALVKRHGNREMSTPNELLQALIAVEQLYLKMPVVETRKRRKAKDSP